MPLKVRVTATLLERAGHWNIMEQIAVAEKLVELSYELTQALDEIRNGSKPCGFMPPQIDALKWAAALAILGKTKS